MPLQRYYDRDADLARLSDKTVAVIGYGNQGHAHALNLHGSGVSVVVGARKAARSWRQAEADGLPVMTTAEAARRAQIVMLTLPDETAADIYAREIAAGLAPGDYLAVAHGFNIHFGAIRPPAGVNVFLVAPKGPGRAVRAQYEQGRGVPALVAVHADPSGDTLAVALAYAKGIGAGRAGMLETSFAEETETDLFGEQAVLCGGLPALMAAGYETLVEAGYSPEVAYFETIQEVKLIADMIYEGGMSRMCHAISNTAEFGGLKTGSRLIDDSVKARMKQILAEVQSGQFAREFILENQTGRVTFEAMRRRVLEHPKEEVGARIRELLPWLDPQPPVQSPGEERE